MAGISTLEVDHVFALGNTVEKIAWHKAGIMKTGRPAFTTHQVKAAAEVLRQRAGDKSVDLKELDVDPRLQHVRVRPDAAFQKRNATLAIALAETALQKLGVLTAEDTKSLPPSFVEGIEKTAFRGRCEVKVEEKIIWHVDGAHTPTSLQMSSTWFAKETANR